MAKPKSYRTWISRWRAFDDLVRRWGQPEWDRGPFVDAAYPPAAREWFALVGAAQRFNDPEVVCLRDGVPSFIPVPGHDFWSIDQQAEGDAHWSIAAKDLEKNDPAVHVHLHDYEADVPRGQPRPFLPAVRVAPSVSAFALDWTLSYLYPEGGLFSVDLAEGAYQPGGPLDETLGAPVKFGHLYLHEADDVLAAHLADDRYEKSIARRALRVFFRTKSAAGKRGRLLDNMLKRSGWVGGSLIDEVD